jgi:hypothetical protein
MHLFIDPPFFLMVKELRDSADISSLAFFPARPFTIDGEIMVNSYKDEQTLPDCF